jgi:hypothetical protein
VAPQKAESSEMYSLRQSSAGQLLAFDEYEIRIFEMLDDNSEETSGFHTIDYPMIECKGEGHDLADGNLSASHDRPILYLS